MSTRSEMYLRMIRESGFWVFPEMNASASGLTPRGVGGVNTGVFQGFPYYVTDQIPDNLGAGTNESEVYFVEVTDCIIGDAMSIEIAASQEAAYDDSGTVRATFSLDQSVIRAISKHDFGLRHDLSVAVLSTVNGWV